MFGLGGWVGGWLWMIYFDATMTVAGAEQGAVTALLSVRLYSLWDILFEDKPHSML